MQEFCVIASADTPRTVAGQSLNVMAMPRPKPSGCHKHSLPYLHKQQSKDARKKLSIHHKAPQRNGYQTLWGINGFNWLAIQLMNLPPSGSPIAKSFQNEPVERTSLVLDAQSVHWVTCCTVHIYQWILTCGQTLLQLQECALFFVQHKERECKIQFFFLHKSIWKDLLGIRCCFKVSILPVFICQSSDEK